MAKREAININYAYQNAVSYSQYSMFSECEYRWYLAYVKKHRVFKPGIHLTFGTSLHEVIQEYLTVMYNQSGKAADALDLNQMLNERLRYNYKESLLENDQQHFSTPQELKEFFEDGVAILEWLKKHRARYFSIKNSELIGVEIPILLPITEKNPNVFMNGYIDLIMYEKNTDSYTIYDIKTSTRGWGDNEKKNQIKMNQVLFYKHFFSKKMGVPEDKIDVRFFIVRRKVFENSEFPMHRVQEFSPAQGKKKVNDAVQHLSNFVTSCFDDKAKHIADRKYVKNTSACKYCQFIDRPNLCDKST